MSSLSFNASSISAKLWGQMSSRLMLPKAGAMHNSLMVPGYRFPGVPSRQEAGKALTPPNFKEKVACLHDRGMASGVEMSRWHGACRFLGQHPLMQNSNGVPGI